MHIPDAILSPSTCAVTGAAMVPVWAISAQRVRKKLGARQVSLLALGSAFCFTIMMFNIPALGGTTAHPVAGTLLAILLGPEAACIGVSVALAIQCLFFGDGGLLAFGANCFTMAFVLPFVGYAVYRLLAGSSSPTAASRAIFAGIGSYVGLNAAAAIVAVLLGIQPALFHEPNGHAIYFPFGMQITLPAMLLTHLIIAGPAEAIVTSLVVRYLQSAGIPLYGSEANKIDIAAIGRKRRRELLWLGLVALISLSPLGLLAKGDAWGEWNKEGLAKQIEKVEGKDKGYVPSAIAAQDAHGFKGVKGLEDYSSDKGAKGYLGAGMLGAGVIALTLLGIGKIFVSKERETDSGLLSLAAADPEVSGASPGELPSWLATTGESTTKES